MLAVQIAIGLDGPEFGDELLELGPALRNDHADRLVDLESHRCQLAGEFPAHAETRACPVGLDDALERRSAVLRIVRRPAHQEVVASRSAKQHRQMPGQDAVTEMAERQQLVGVRLVGPDYHVHAVLLTEPRSSERTPVTQLPTTLIGDEHGQTATRPTRTGL